METLSFKDGKNEVSDRGKLIRSEMETQIIVHGAPCHDTQLKHSRA